MPKSSYPGPAQAIGRTLKAWRTERGLTLRGVARASDESQEAITFDYLSRLENGLLMPSLPKLAALADIYQRPVSELFDLYENEALRRLVPKKKSYEMLHDLGIKSLDRGEITKATACFLGALDVARADPEDRQRLAVAHNNVAGALIRGGRYLTARQYLEAGLEYVQGVHTRVRLLDNLAIVHYHLHNLQVAEVFSREASILASVDPIVQTLTRGTRATILADLKRHAEAETLMRKALDDYRAGGKEIEEIRYLYNLGSCLFEQGKLDEAFSMMRNAAARASERGDPDLRAKSLFFYGRCLFKSGRKEEAGGPLRSSLRLAGEHDLRNEAFGAAYYLWLLAAEIGADEEAEKFHQVARQYRTRLQQRTDESEAFDGRGAQWGRRASKSERSQTLRE